MKRQYIAAATPLPGYATTQFREIIPDENVQVVVMLDKEIFKSENSNRYWRDNVGIHNLDVETSHKRVNGILLQKIPFELGSGIKTVQLQYSNWPVGGVPEKNEYRNILLLIQKLREYSSEKNILKSEYWAKYDDESYCLITIIDGEVRARPVLSQFDNEYKISIDSLVSIKKERKKKSSNPINTIKKAMAKIRRTQSDQ